MFFQIIKYQFINLKKIILIFKLPKVVVITMMANNKVQIGSANFHSGLQ